MKTLMRLAWTGLLSFLLCMVISLWNINSDPSLSGLFLGLALPSAALFFGGMLGAHYHIEETDGERAARCLHTARWLNRKLQDHMLEGEKLQAEVDNLSGKLASKSLDIALALKSEQDTEGHNRLRLEFAETAESILSSAKEAYYLQKRLNAYAAETARLKEMADQAEAKIRMAHVLSKGRTWIGGPPVAGQYILVGEIEPQRLLIITHQVFKTKLKLAEEAGALLAHSSKQASAYLDALSRTLTSAKI